MRLAPCSPQQTDNRSRAPAPAAAGPPGGEEQAQQLAREQQRGRAGRRNVGSRQGRDPGRGRELGPGRPAAPRPLLLLLLLLVGRRRGGTAGASHALSPAMEAAMRRPSRCPPTSVWPPQLSATDPPPRCSCGSGCCSPPLHLRAGGAARKATHPSQHLLAALRPKRPSSWCPRPAGQQRPVLPPPLPLPPCRCCHRASACCTTTLACWWRSWFQRCGLRQGPGWITSTTGCTCASTSLQRWLIGGLQAVALGKGGRAEREAEKRSASPGSLEHLLQGLLRRLLPGQRHG